MLLRGYQGEYQYMRERIGFVRQDLAYLLFWLGVFAVFRMWPVILVVGGLFS